MKKKSTNLLNKERNNKKKSNFIDTSVFMIQHAQGLLVRFRLSSKKSNNYCELVSVVY